MTFAAVALSLAATALAQSAPDTSTSVVLVLDASGSMFNELPDGRFRITAAKEALATFVSRLPESTELSVGLRVYGSQVMALAEGSCQDSLLTVPVAPLDRQLLLNTVQTTEALGATPIAYSLELAADDLAGATGRKIIVLVTDGEESCGGDVRAVAERLAGVGFEVDLHVIGFALTPEAARSFEGVGTFQSANSAAELAAALGHAIELPTEDRGLPVRVRLTRDGAPVELGATVSFAAAVDGTEHAFREVAAGEFEVVLPAGSYTAVVSDAFARAPQTISGLSVSPDVENTFDFELAPEFAVELTVSPVDPVMGGRVTVSFTGAAEGAAAWLTVTSVDAPDDTLVAVEGVTGASGSADVIVPFGEFELEARYHLHLPEGGTQVIGRSEPFTARHVEATLEAPAEVAGGASFDVAWDGPNNEGDMLVVAPEGSQASTSLAYTFTQFGNPGTLDAPVEAGRYEVRYLAGSGGGVLAALPLLVTASEVSVTAPAEVMGGSNVAVTWEGPDGTGDMVAFAPEGAPAETFMSTAFTVWGSSLELVAPVQPGTYEVRYLSGSERSVLASVPVTVTEPTVELRAPAEVASGAVFTVEWTGPDGAGDYVALARPGAPDWEYLNVAFTDWGPTLELTAPEEPGSYEIRYFSGFARITLSRVAVQVR